MHDQTTFNSETNPMSNQYQQQSIPTSAKLTESFDSMSSLQRKGMPWIQRGVNPSLSNGSNITDQAQQRYHGGLMKSESDTSKERKRHFHLLMSNKRSPPVTSVKSSDTLESFKSNEWTPPDSSYGAACPVCGCVPKRVRRMIEISLLAAMAIGFIYLLVSTSIYVSNERHKNATNSSNMNSGQVALDDDAYYVAFDDVVNGQNNNANDNDDYAMNNAQQNNDGGRRRLRIRGSV